MLWLSRTAGCSSSGSRPTSGTPSPRRPTPASSPTRASRPRGRARRDMDARGRGAGRRGARRGPRPTSCASWRRSGARRRVRARRRICWRRSNSRTAASSRPSTTAAAAGCACPDRRTGCRRTPVEVRSAPALGCVARLPRRAPARTARRSPPGPRPRRRAHARLHVGGGRSVRDVPARAAGRRGREGRVDPAPRPGPARLPADYGGINRSPNFNELNLDKRSFQVDLSQPDGLDLAHRLVRLGRRRGRQLPSRRHGPIRARTPASCSTRRPDLIVASSSANGSTGPEAHGGRPGQHLRRDRRVVRADRLPRRSADARSASRPTTAAPTRWPSPSLAALLHRARTGEGQHIDLASREVVAASAPDALLGRQLGVAWDLRVGNGHRDFSPHDVYPAAGRGRVGGDRGRRRRPSGRRCARCSVATSGSPRTRRRGAPGGERRHRRRHRRVDGAATLAGGVRDAAGRRRARHGRDDERGAGHRPACRPRGRLRRGRTPRDRTDPR